MTGWVPRCYFQEGPDWPCGGACWVGLWAPGERGLLGAFLCPGSRTVPWVEEVVASGGSSAAACLSSLLGRPPSFSAALWLKCPDGQGPAGRGLVHAWNSPCSGIRVGQGPGAEGGSICWLRVASLPAWRWKDNVLCSRPPSCSGEVRGPGPGVSVVVRLQRGCGMQGCSLWQGPGASPAELPSGEAPLAVKRLHSPGGRWWAHCCSLARPHSLCDPLDLGCFILLSCCPWLPVILGGLVKGLSENPCERCDAMQRDVR